MRHYKLEKEAKEHVVGLVGRLDADEIVAVYEAGPTGYKLLEWLEEFGCDAFMTPPTHVRQKKGGKRVKTDRRDSYDLAEQARAGRLPSVHALGEETYCERQVVRTRGQLVEHRSSAKAQVKSLLLFHGVKAPERLKTNWSRPTWPGSKMAPPTTRTSICRSRRSSSPSKASIAKSSALKRVSDKWSRVKSGLMKPNCCEVCPESAR